MFFLLQVKMKASTVKETFRLPLLPPDQGDHADDDDGGGGDVDDVGGDDGEQNLYIVHR